VRSAAQYLREAIVVLAHGAALHRRDMAWRPARGQRRICEPGDERSYMFLIRL
jgi:hypothetical protein